MEVGIPGELGVVQVGVEVPESEEAGEDKRRCLSKDWESSFFTGFAVDEMCEDEPM